jgi:hypothetical protein
MFKTLCSYFIQRYIVIFLFVSFGTNSILHAEIVFPLYAGMSDNTFSSTQLYVQKQAGTSEIKAHSVYFPVNVSSSQSDRQNHSWYTTLPLITSGLPLIPKLQLKFSHDEDSNKAIHIAVKKLDGHYQILSSVQDLAPLTEQTFSLRIYDICYLGNCSLETYASGDINENQFLAIFLGDKDQYNEGDLIDFGDGDQEPLYLNILFSSLYESTETVALSEILRGDKYLVVKYHTNNLSRSNKSLLHKIILIRYDQLSQGQSSRTISSVRSTVNDDHLTFHEDSDLHLIRVENLTNNTEYFFATAGLNKFFFVTKSSLASAKTPLDIEAFLKQQGCYLISAGYQQNHWVLQTYRLFRDQWLSQFSLGRTFIQFYYSSAFDLALTVSQSMPLRFVVMTLSILALPVIWFFLLPLFWQGVMAFLLVVGIVFYFQRKSYIRKRK